MKDFRTLKVWEKSHRLVLDIYQGTRDFPKEELYGITSQLRRAAVSVPTSIAEGCGRRSAAEFSRFLQIAFGSASEVEYLILLCQELGFLARHEAHELTTKIVEIKKMLATLLKKLNADS